MTYYANQLVSVLIGVAWGVAPLTGYVGVLRYLTRRTERDRVCACLC